MYKLINGFKGIPVGVAIQKDGFVFSIPFDKDNSDYIAYLKWVSEGNQPISADE